MEPLLNRFAYRAYYEYQGPSHGDPMPALEKDAKEIAYALSRVPFELSVLLSDQDATVTGAPGVGFSHSITVFVNTTQDGDSVDATVGRCLDSLNLLGGKLDPATLTCPRCAALQRTPDREKAGAHLRPDEGATYTGGAKTWVSVGNPPLETTFSVYRCLDHACRTRWLRYVNKGDDRFVAWQLAAQVGR
jgi:hypothetical protein